MTTDHQLKQDVTAELDWEPSIKADHIGVAAENGVKSPVDTVTVGDDIRHALHRSYYYDDNIEVTADGGRVHLTGTVASWREHELASATAWAAQGTTAVRNDITIA